MEMSYDQPNKDTLFNRIESDQYYADYTGVVE